MWQGGAAAAAQAAALRETKFTYEEDTHPELFFAPYLWAMAFAYTSDVAWTQPASGFGRPGAVRLFPLASTKVYVMGTPASDEEGAATAPAPAPAPAAPAPAPTPAPPPAPAPAPPPAPVPAAAAAPVVTVGGRAVPYVTSSALAPRGSRGVAAV